MPIIDQTRVRVGNKIITLYKKECEREECNEVFVTKSTIKVYHSDYCRTKDQNTRKQARIKVFLKNLEDAMLTPEERPNKNEYRNSLEYARERGIPFNGICDWCMQPVEGTRKHPECYEKWLKEVGL